MISLFTPKLARGESILFRRGAFVSMIGLSAVAVLLATGSAVGNGGVRWSVVELAVMGIALAALPVAFFASGVRLGLEPGETGPMRLRCADNLVARLYGLIAIPFLSLAISFLLWRVLSRASGGLGDYGTELLTPAEWLFVIGGGLGIFLSFQFLLEKALNKFGRLFLTNRRAIRFTPGMWFGRIEVLDLADVAEIREHPFGITLIAASRDAMRRLLPNGGSEPAGVDRLDLPMSRFRFPWAAMSQYDRAVALLGRAPLRWQTPSLPRQVQRLVSLEAMFPDIVAVLAAIPMLALVIAEVVRLEAFQGDSRGAFVAVGLTSVLVLSGLGAAGYCMFLWLAARGLTPENAALFLRASFHPDWGVGRWPQKTYITARRAALKRRERIASWLAGRPVAFEGGPGPEAFGGGWRE